MKDADIDEFVWVCLAKGKVILIGQSTEFRGILITETEQDRRCLTQGLHINTILLHNSQPSFRICILWWIGEFFPFTIIFCLDDNFLN